MDKGHEIPVQPDEIMALFRLQFEGMPLGCIFFGTDFHISLWNPAAERIFGFTSTEAVGKHPYALIVPEEVQPAVNEVWRRLLMGDDTACGMNRNVTRDGASIFCKWTNTPIKKPDGSVYGVLSMVEDITACQKAEKDRRRNEQLFRDLVERSSDWIWEIDEQNNYIYASPQVKNVLGYTPQEIIGKTPFDLMEPDEAARMAEFFGQISSARQPFHLFENANLHKDGHKVTLETSGVPVFDENGTYAGYRGVDRDITERKMVYQALRESQALFASAFEHAPIGMALVAPDGRWLRVNRALCDLVGYSEEELLTKTFQDITHPEDLESDLEYVRRMLAGEIMIYHMEKRYFHKQGHIVWVSLSVSLVHDENGKPLHFISQIQDVTGRRRVENALHVSEAKYRKLLESTTDYIFSVRVENGRTVETIHGEACENITGYTPGDFRENVNLWYLMVHPDDRQMVLDQANKALAGEITHQLEHRIFHKNGSLRWLRITMVLSKDSDGNVIGYDGCISDITERKKAEEKLAFQSVHDGLTGLPNRVLFMQSLEMSLQQIKRHGGAMAILFIDIDQFKLVNDTLGHDAGDALLCQVGPRMRQAIRATDLLARQGGDEFIVLMVNYNEHAMEGSADGMIVTEAANVAGRIIQVMKEPFSLGSQEVYVGASIGISLFPDDADDSQKLFQHADSAMYKAKELGRGNFLFFSNDLSDYQQKRALMVNRLHKAIEEKEFSLEYQPIVDLETGAMVGVEALIRWRDEDGKWISPADFIPAAEECGLILEIGDWVLGEACGMLRQWQDKGIPLHMSVNLSVRQFWHDDILAKVMDAINRMGIARDRLDLEVTESAMIRDPQRMESIMQRFSERGLSISLDDFGTGYSSLHRLKALPINKLKIDRSFVGGIPHGRDDVSIVTAIVNLAHNLGIPALAEGIETREQWDFLRGLGCEYGQGFYFSRSVPAAEIEAMLQREPAWIRVS